MVKIKEENTLATDNVSVLDQMLKNNHEQVVYCTDNVSGLKAIIAVHNTTLGPGLGGLRMWNYNNEEEALRDVLRLSRGMTYKASVAGLNLGGGKAVIIGDARKDKTEMLLRRFGKFVESLSGKYITAEDVGMSSKDMEYIHMETSHVSGLPESMGGSGDPSPVTAYGVYLGIKSAAKEMWGNDSLSGKKVIVQGLGHVGEHVVKHLSKENAKVFANDIYEDRVKHIVKEYKAEAVSADELYELDADIYAPCALGATVNDETLSKLKCSIIAGAANNQLADEKIHGEALTKKGILYAPDFVINAGGLINVYSELEGYNRERAMAKAENIYNTLLSIYKTSKDENMPTYLAANKLAEKRITEVGRLKLSF